MSDNETRVVQVPWGTREFCVPIEADVMVGAQPSAPDYERIVLREYRHRDTGTYRQWGYGPRTRTVVVAYP